MSDILPTEAHNILITREDSYLLDIRTKEEVNLIGHPFVRGIKFIEWRMFPGMEKNTSFIHQLNSELPGKSIMLLVICRSGSRSSEAVDFLITEGYKNSYNILKGFEGDLDQLGHRGQMNGWKAEGLPWKQN